MSEFVLQRVQEVDLPRLVPEFAREFLGGNRKRAEDHFEDHASGEGTSVIAREGGHLAGFVTIRWQSNDPLLRSENVPLIHQLEVLPRFQRRGLGDALLEEAERLVASRSRRVAITVGLDRAYGPAQRLYARRGYIPDGRGVCLGHEPVKKGSTVEVNDELIFWLLKDLERTV